MPPRPRAYWKGYLRLSLVSIGVELYAATTSVEATALHQIHKPTGKRVRYEKVVPGVGPIEASDIVKGFEIDDDSYVVLEPEELEEIKLESSRSIELAQFVDRAEIDPRYFEKPYYVVPEGDVSTEGFIVIRDSLTSTGKVGLGKLTMRGTRGSCRRHALRQRAGPRDIAIPERTARGRPQFRGYSRSEGRQ